ncbi:hypothetical protein DRN67_02675 [Candidatus Micrarchaeota archaeon]|nr:MAG: hypothetical protein DRN67_02675 [Candidatus Micrarchaeota archaeon]
MHEIKFGNYLENTSAEMKIEVLEAKKIFLEEVSELKREEVLEVLKDLSKNGIGKNVRFYAKMEFEARKGKE